MKLFATTMSKNTRRGKLARQGAGLAMNIAKKSNDPLFAKYKKAQSKFKSLKEQLKKKYEGKARAKLGMSF